MSDVLVAIVVGERRVGVVRDGEHVVLTDDVDGARGGTVLSDHRPAVTGIEDLTVQGGLLPPGATAVEVVDRLGERVSAAVANGAWVALLDGPVDGRDHPVRFTARAGETVHRAPLPAEWPRTEVADAGEPCPACGAAVWDEVVPLDRSRGSRGSGGAMDPTPVVVCRVCGHEEVEGSIMRLAAPDNAPPPDPEALRAAAELRRDHVRMALTDLPFPVFAAAGRHPEYDGSGSRGNEPTSIRISHGEALSVETSVDELRLRSDREQARQALEHLLWDVGLRSRFPDDASDAAVSLWFAARRREGQQAAARAAGHSAVFRVDGRSEVFEVVESGERWAAFGWLGEVAVTITARGIDPESVVLERLEDPTVAVPSVPDPPADPPHRPPDAGPAAGPAGVGAVNSSRSLRQPGRAGAILYPR